MHARTVGFLMDLELTKLARLASKLWGFSCINFPTARITNIHINIPGICKV